MMLERGQAIEWVQRQLGHLNISLTVDTYGRWAKDAEDKHAARITRDGAPV
jgi:integrase